MNHIEAILRSDDLNVGSFGSLEKGIGYTTLALISIPILLIPFFYVAVGRSLFKLTALLLGCLLCLFLVLRFRFSWIVWLDHHLRPFYT